MREKIKLLNEVMYINFSAILFFLFFMSFMGVAATLVCLILVAKFISYFNGDTRFKYLADILLSVLGFVIFLPIKVHMTLEDIEEEFHDNR